MDEIRQSAWSRRTLLLFAQSDSAAGARVVRISARLGYGERRVRALDSRAAQMLGGQPAASASASSSRDRMPSLR